MLFHNWAYISLITKTIIILAIAFLVKGSGLYASRISDGRLVLAFESEFSAKLSASIANIIESYLVQESFQIFNTLNFVETKKQLENVRFSITHASAIMKKTLHDVLIYQKMEDENKTPFPFVNWFVGVIIFSLVLGFLLKIFFTRIKNNDRQVDKMATGNKKIKIKKYFFKLFKAAFLCILFFHLCFNVDVPHKNKANWFPKMKSSLNFSPWKSEGVKKYTFYTYPVFEKSTDDNRLNNEASGISPELSQVLKRDDPNIEASLIATTSQSSSEEPVASANPLPNEGPRYQHSPRTTNLQHLGSEIERSGAIADSEITRGPESGDARCPNGEVGITENEPQGNQVRASPALGNIQLTLNGNIIQMEVGDYTAVNLLQARNMHNRPAPLPTDVPIHNDLSDDDVPIDIDLAANKGHDRN